MNNELMSRMLHHYQKAVGTLDHFLEIPESCKDDGGKLCQDQTVFEHDILSDQNGNILGSVRFTDERGWMVGVESLYDYTDRYDEKEALIVGNIYNNPELLTK